MGRDFVEAARYQGYKGRFEGGVFVFQSPDERDRWQRDQYGETRNGFRLPHEPTDERPMVKILDPLWQSESERLEYEHASEETVGVLPSRRVELICAKAGGAYGEVAKKMPPAMGRSARDAELQKLRVQAARAVLGEGEEDE